MLGGGGRCGGVIGLAARLPPLPGPSRVSPDLDSSDSSLRYDDDSSILGLFLVPPPRSMRRLPRPLVRGVVSITVSLTLALLHESRPGVLSSDSESLSLDFICVKDPGSSPSACVTSPSSWPDSPRSLPASSESVGVASLSGGPKMAYSSNWFTHPSKSPFPSYFSGLRLNFFSSILRCSSPSQPWCSTPRPGGDVAGVDALKSNRRVALSLAVSALTPFPSRFFFEEYLQICFHACGHHCSVQRRSNTTATSVTTVPLSVCYGGAKPLGSCGHF